MHLPIIAALALAVVGASVTPAAATQRLAKPDDAALVTRIADLDGPAMGAQRRKGRIHRYRRAFAYWRERPVVITSGHRLHYFPGEIVYTYLPGECCWRRGGR
jgi:hypothetical protein